MKKGKYEQKRRYCRRASVGKSLTLLMALVLMVGSVIGGTMAWLTADPVTVENTFTATNIEVTLVETKGLNNEGKWVNKMIPGAVYEKDPTVTVTDNTTVDCYLFVKFEESENASQYLTYESALTMDNGWTQGDGTGIPENVWYRTVETNATTKSWTLLKDNKVTVNAENVTKDNMNTAAQAKLTYTAYAVQFLGFEDAKDAWVSTYGKPAVTPPAEPVA